MDSAQRRKFGADTVGMDGFVGNILKMASGFGRKVRLHAVRIQWKKRSFIYDVAEQKSTLVLHKLGENLRNKSETSNINRRIK